MAAPDLSRLVPDYIQDFEAYIPAQPDPELMRLYGVDHLHRLNNNENPLGPPPAAREFLEAFESQKASIYPSGDSFYLRRELAQRFDMEPDQFLVGNGANEVIAFAIKAFCEKGDNIVTADKTFAVYEWVAEFSGFAARLAPLNDFGFDAEAMKALVDERTKIVFLCNPNNPTGTWWDRAALSEFLGWLDGRAIMVVDEAYCEFVDDPRYPDGMQLMRQHPNLVVFRTFSKMYALAGLRIGYLCGPLPVVDVIRRTCVVYSVNTLAQEAARAALAHGAEHVAATRAHVAREKAFLLEHLGRLGLTVQADQGPYVMARLPMSDTLAYRRLMAQGVMVRSMTGFRFPNWIRISVGSHEAMASCVAALESIL